MARATKKEREIIDAAIKRLKICVDADNHNRVAAIDDLKFANGEQWDEGEKKRRADKGRPALQINLLPKFIDQVVGDMLHNSPSIKVRPIDSDADIHIAKIRQGIIANIEYLSNSKAIYGYAGRQQVTCGYGAWRILTRYTDENPFLQEIYEEAIRNPFLVYMDPSAKDQNYADAKYGFILEKMSKDTFKERYPKAQLPDSSGIDTGTGLGSELWYEGDTVTVAEYFTVESEKKMMLQLESGEVVTEEEFKKLESAWDEKNSELKIGIAQSAPEGGVMPDLSPGAEQMAAPSPMPGPGGPLPADPGVPPGGPVPGPPVHPPLPQSPAQPPDIGGLLGKFGDIGPRPAVSKRRETDSIVIKHRILTSAEILEGGAEGKRVAGKFIPIVLVKGKELNIEGKNYVYSLIRHAKDPQKMVNYWNTSAAETIALAPKAPWVGTAKQFEGYENDYLAANVENFPYLKYNSDPDAPGPPQRQAPAQPPTAIFEQIRRGEENLKSVIGMFNADVGAPGSEQTGAAITARQRPGDIGTFEFMENLTRAVLHAGRIINEMIPEIYDSERDVRLRHLDETESFVPVNTTVGTAADKIKKNPERFSGLDPAKLREAMSKHGRGTRFNDITAGKYDVAITTGPSYATQRQEAAQHLLQLVQAMPGEMAIAKDIIVRNLDFKDADELAARFRKTLPPGLAKPLPGEQPYTPPPSPEAIAAQVKGQSEQAKVQMATVKLEQEKIRLEAEKLKIQNEQIRLQIELAKLQKELNPEPKMPTPEYDVAEAFEKDRRYGLEVRKQELAERKMEHQTGVDAGKLANDRLKAESTLVATLAKQGLSLGDSEGNETAGDD